MQLQLDRENLLLVEIQFQEVLYKGWLRGQEPPGSVCVFPEMQCVPGLWGLCQQRPLDSGRELLPVNCWESFLVDTFLLRVHRGMVGP